MCNECGQMSVNTVSRLPSYEGRRKKSASKMNDIAILWRLDGRTNHHLTRPIKMLPFHSVIPACKILLNLVSFVLSE